MSLFQLGQFKLHSGGTSDWKIDCDELTWDDWVTLAELARRRVGPFKVVIDAGGASVEFARALAAHTNANASHILIADDVFTTGATMEFLRKHVPAREQVRGVVVFARGPCPEWVTPLFAWTGGAPV